MDMMDPDWNYVDWKLVRRLLKHENDRLVEEMEDQNRELRNVIDTQKAVGAICAKLDEDPLASPGEAAARAATEEVRAMAAGPIDEEAERENKVYDNMVLTQLDTVTKELNYVLSFGNDHSREKRRRIFDAIVRLRDESDTLWRKYSNED